MLLQNTINLRYCTSGWIYYRNILRCAVLQTANSVHLRLSVSCRVKIRVKEHLKRGINKTVDTNIVLKTQTLYNGTF